MPEPGTYESRRPLVVPPSLAHLAGPRTGTVVLPPGIAWTGRRVYDLQNGADAAVLYERVIVEATDARDLVRLLNAERLKSSWRDLYLPRRVRLTWEASFPELAAAA